MTSETDAPNDVRSLAEFIPPRSAQAEQVHLVAGHNVKEAIGSWVDTATEIAPHCLADRPLDRKSRPSQLLPATDSEGVLGHAYSVVEKRAGHTMALAWPPGLQEGCEGRVDGADRS